MFINDGSPVSNVTVDGWSESAPHSKIGAGISFQFSGSATELSGFPESTNLLNLPDVDFERRYTLHFYPLAGYVPFVMAHNLDHECAPAVFWMNPSDTFYRLKTSATTHNSFILSETSFIDIILFLAPVAEILPQYFHLAGFPFLPPAFSLDTQIRQTSRRLWLIYLRLIFRKMLNGLSLIISRITNQSLCHQLGGRMRQNF
jgi:alpha-glucosidase (family GH31 glycosyl hydrolase)